MYVSYNLKYCYIQRRGGERRRRRLEITAYGKKKKSEDFQAGQ